MTALGPACRSVLRCLGVLPADTSTHEQSIHLMSHAQRCPVCTRRLRNADRIAESLRRLPALRLSAAESEHIWQRIHEPAEASIEVGARDGALSAWLAAAMVPRPLPLPVRSGATLSAAFVDVLEAKVPGDVDVEGFLSSLAEPPQGLGVAQARCGTGLDAQPEPELVAVVAETLVPSRKSPGWIWSRVRWELRALRAARDSDSRSNARSMPSYSRNGARAMDRARGAIRWFVQATALAAALVLAAYLISRLLPETLSPEPEPLRAFQILDLDRAPLPGFMPEHLTRQAATPFQAAGAESATQRDENQRDGAPNGDHPARKEEGR